LICATSFLKQLSHTDGHADKKVFIITIQCVVDLTNEAEKHGCSCSPTRCEVRRHEQIPFLVEKLNNETKYNFGNKNFHKCNFNLLPVSSFIC